MKHLLNEMSEEEKNNIRSQHTDSISVNTENFKKLVENKLGNVKPLINENDEGMIRIPSMYNGIRMELGKSVDPNDIIEMYNELAGGTPLVDYSDGTFHNEEDDEIPLDVIFDELNYAIVGEEDGDDYDYLMSQAREFLIEFGYDDPESVNEMGDMEVIKVIKILDKELYEKIQNIRARPEY